MTDKSSPATRALIFRDNLKFNIEKVRSLLKEKTMICAAVKAGGYGHGAVEVSRTALEAGVHCLGVSSAAEGVELRKAGIKAPILLFSHAVNSEIDTLCEWKIEPFAGSMEYIRQLESTAVRCKKTLNVHLKIDTGMGRIGCRPWAAPELAKYIADSSSMRLKGTCTHFPVADGINRKDREFTENQISLFKKTVKKISDAGTNPGIVHAANSAAIAAWSGAHFDMVRPGIILYGYYPAPNMEKPVKIKPVMQLETSLVNIKKVKAGESISYGRIWTAKEDSVIGTISAGYGDGYPRLLSNKAEVSCRGKRYHQAGRICMDQCMIVLGPVTATNADKDSPELNDRIVLFGPGEGMPTAEDLAGLTGTIPYEITCGINSRVPRIYC